MERTTVQSVEVNVLYMMALAMDLIIRDADRRMRAIGGGFKESKRTEFKMFLKANGFRYEASECFGLIHFEVLLNDEE